MKLLTATTLLSFLLILDAFDACSTHKDIPKDYQKYVFVKYNAPVAKQSELDMCLWNTDAPGGNKVQLWQKSLSPTFWPRPTPQGRVMSVKCEQPLDELTVQVW